MSETKNNTTPTREPDVRRTALQQEAISHDVDSFDGAPLDLGDGITITMHSAKCRRCAHLTREAASKVAAWAERVAAEKNRSIQ